MVDRSRIDGELTAAYRRLANPALRQSCPRTECSGFRKALHVWCPEQEDNISYFAVVADIDLSHPGLCPLVREAAEEVTDGA